jgi:hypothetical protein
MVKSDTDIEKPCCGTSSPGAPRKSVVHENYSKLMGLAPRFVNNSNFLNIHKPEKQYPMYIRKSPSPIKRLTNRQIFRLNSRVPLTNAEINKILNRLFSWDFVFQDVLIFLQLIWNIHTP